MARLQKEFGDGTRTTRGDSSGQNVKIAKKRATWGKGKAKVSLSEGFSVGKLKKEKKSG